MDLSQDGAQFLDIAFSLGDFSQGDVLEFLGDDQFRFIGDDRLIDSELVKIGVRVCRVVLLRYWRILESAF